MWMGAVLLLQRASSARQVETKGNGDPKTGGFESANTPVSPRRIRRSHCAPCVVVSLCNIVGAALQRNGLVGMQRKNVGPVLQRRCLLASRSYVCVFSFCLVPIVARHDFARTSGDHRTCVLGRFLAQERCCVRFRRRRPRVGIVSRVFFFFFSVGEVGWDDGVGTSEGRNIDSFFVCVGLRFVFNWSALALHRKRVHRTTTKWPSSTFPSYSNVRIGSNPCPRRRRSIDPSLMRLLPVSFVGWFLPHGSPFVSWLDPVRWGGRMVRSSSSSPSSPSGIHTNTPQTEGVRGCRAQESWQGPLHWSVCEQTARGGGRRTIACLLRVVERW